jgi:ferredoxin
LTGHDLHQTLLVGLLLAGLLGYRILQHVWDSRTQERHPVMVTRRRTFWSGEFRASRVHHRGSPPPPTASAPRLRLAPEPEAPRDLPVVAFRRSRKITELFPGQTILEAAENVGIELSFECRAGHCGSCKTRLLAGQVTMAAETALTPTDRSEGIILACQARSRSSLIVDL